MNLYRPHSLAPTKETARVILVYKNNAHNPHVSHIGLGVTSLNTAQVLRNMGIWADVWPISSAEELGNRVKTVNDQALAQKIVPISHVVIAAPWIDTPAISRLVSAHLDVNWAVTSHSNVAFLHVDPNATRLMVEGVGLAQQWGNFRIAGNSNRFCTWMRRTYGANCAYLPNLYAVHHTADHEKRPQWKGGILRIGSFGAARILKNHASSAAAAAEISRRLGTDVEFWLNSGRHEGILSQSDTIRHIIEAAPHCTLKTFGWASWPEFRDQVRTMNILLQPSFTETFNMVSADGACQGIPSVVSDAIEWAPDHWKAAADDAVDIANKAIALLYDPYAGAEGKEALHQFVNVGKQAWLDYLLPDVG